MKSYEKTVECHESINSDIILSRPEIWAVPITDPSSNIPHVDPLTRRVQRQVDAMCINCDEFIPARNLELHSQHCTGSPRRQVRTQRNFVDDDLDLTEFLNHGNWSC